MLFSDRTPKKIKNIVADYENKISCFRALHFSDEETRDFRNLLVKYIKQIPADVYITSRRDNDDVLNMNYIKYIQDYVNRANNLANYGIVYPLGYQYSPKHNDIRTYCFPNNHFSTYVSNDSEKMIFDFLHEDFGKTEEIIYI